MSQQMVEATETGETGEAASVRVDALMQKIMDGQAVSAKQLAEAQAEANLAEMQREAKRRRVIEEKRIARLNDIQAEQESLTKRFHPEAIEELKGQAEKAIEAYVRAVAEHQSKLRDVRDWLRSNGYLPGTMPGQVEGYEASDGNPVRIGAVSVFNVQPRATLKRILDAVLERHFSRGVE
jgi:multidrug efflux pump subunit AcrA (membrane-fusion protein)